MSVAHEPDTGLLDDVLRESAEQWMSLAESCMDAGYFLCQIDSEVWQLLPLSVLGKIDH